MSSSAQPSRFELIHAAAEALNQRRDEVNKLNVFPVPDGDTGTNMALTMDAVLAEVDTLAPDADVATLCRALTHGSLMGARGNSGVILSQVIRGICDVLGQASSIDAPVVCAALENSVTVAFQAVRKPVEGTMLTVLRDAAAAAAPCAQTGADIPTVLASVVEAAYESVRRTPDLLPVLKENGVVDAGGYGLAILMDGVAARLAGTGIHTIPVTVPAGLPAGVTEQQANDWDDEEYLYCTEFLLFGDGIDPDSVRDFVTAKGGSELVVGGEGSFKVHVHTDDPASVLEYATSIGEVADVHINNMRRQTIARADALRAEGGALGVKPIGFVAVAAGDGLAGILTSLGVDRIVSGGQTMNPSTAELLEAIEEVPARTVIVLPDNRNIIMAAHQTIGLASKDVLVVPTTSVPEAFSAMLAADTGSSDAAAVADTMTDAAAAVRTGEITTAIKDSSGKAGPVKAGQLIGIADHEIEAIGSDLGEVSEALLDAIVDDGSVLTLLAGETLSDEQLDAVAARLSAAHPELEVEAHRGGQPLYPIIMAVE